MASSTDPPKTPEISTTPESTTTGDPAVLNTWLRRVQARQTVVAVIGLGYVGLPLAIAFAQRGFRVLGLDIDAAKVDAINGGTSYIRHIDAATFKDDVAQGRLNASTDFARVADADAILLCLPTPLDRHLQPDLSYVTGTIDAILPHIRPGQLISLESTTYPGTTREQLTDRFQNAGWVVGEQVFVVYSPEREDPGNPEFAATNIPKVVGGATTACQSAGIAIYGAVFDQIVPVSSPAVAELTKLLENIYRAVNIGLVNELKLVADAMNIDIWEVIAAAATKPFGFKPFYPGPGLGGHCIPIDPFYLTWKAREFDVHTRFIELAGQVNRSMPRYVVDACIGALNDVCKSIRDSRVLVIGLAYKPNVDDDRESPTYELMDLLDELGAKVSYHDPFVPVVRPSREHSHWAGHASVAWQRSVIESFDLVLISTWHDCLDIGQLGQWARRIVDTRNATHPLDESIREAKVIKA